MKRITRNTFSEIVSNRHAEYMKNKPVLQKQLKNGNWGKPFVCEFAKNRETAVEYMESLNPGQKYRLAEQI